MKTLRPLLGLATILLLSGSALSGYTGGGTFVAKTPLGTVVDNGGAICQGTAGDGIGGGCLPFPGEGREGFVGVMDDSAGKEVAFQVCIDNNGDGICGGPQNDGRCFDQIFFSHADDGKFFNPLGPLPTSFLSGCGAGAHNGYVVLLCSGEHVDATGPHTHAPRTGTISLTASGSGYGDFCGGGASGGAANPVNTVAKAYKVI